MECCIVLERHIPMCRWYNTIGNFESDINFDISNTTKPDQQVFANNITFLWYPYEIYEIYEMCMMYHCTNVFVARIDVNHEECKPLSVTKMHCCYEFLLADGGSSFHLT